MIQHIVLLRIKPGTTAEQKAALLDSLVALKGTGRRHRVRRRR